MLPDFRVPIVLGGESHHLLVQDVPACVFWQGYPDPDQVTRDQSQALVSWLQHLLIRVTMKPALDLAWIRSWGDDYEPPILRYLEAIGFTPQPVVAAVEPGKLLDRDGVPVERETLADLAAFRGCIPPPHVQALFRVVAGAWTVLPSQLWLGWASEFFFNYHAMSDEQKAGAPLPEVRR